MHPQFDTGDDTLLQGIDDTLQFANRPFYERVTVASNGCNEVGLRDISHERVPYVEQRTIDGHVYQFHHAHYSDVAETSSILTLGVDITSLGMIEQEQPDSGNNSTSIIFGRTEHNRMKEELHLSRKILDHVNALILVAERDGAIVYAGRAIRTILGYEPTEILGDAWWQRNRPDDSMDSEHASMYLARSASGDFPIYDKPYERIVRHRNGEYRWIAWHDARGPGQLCISIGYDITERKRAEDALKASEARYRAIIEEMTEMICRFRTDSTITFVNHTYCRYFGRDRDQCLGRSFLEVIPVDDWQLIRRHLATLTIDRPVATLEHRSIDANGNIRWHYWTNRAIFSIQGDLIEFQSTGWDITEQRQAQEALRESEARYRAISELTSDYAGSFRVEEDGSLIREWITDAFLRITGFTPEELDECHGWPQLIHPHDRVQFLDRMERRMRLLAGQSDVSEHRIVTKHGEVRWLREYARPVWDASCHRVIRIYTATQDITERKRAEEALRISEENFRLLAEHAQDVIFRYRLTEPRGYEYISPSVTTMLGYTPEEYDTDPDLDLKLINHAHFDTLRASPESHCEPLVLCLTRRDSKQVWIEQRTCTIMDEHGNPVAIEGISRNITDRRNAEIALQHSYAQQQQWIAELERYNRDMTLLNAMTEQLQRCMTNHEAYQIIQQFAEQLFTNMIGAVYLLNITHTQYQAVVSWGIISPDELLFTPGACCVTIAEPHIISREAIPCPCRHINEDVGGMSLGIPMETADSVFGVFHVRTAPGVTLTDDDHWRQLALTVTDHIALALANLTLREQLRLQSIKDPLTGLFNRRHLEQAFEQAISAANRHHESVAVILLDIDNVKRFNDTYGHKSGDRVLPAVGEFLRTHLRSHDTACRYGGEEFILILPKASADEAYACAEALRQGMHHLAVTSDDRQSLPKITCSFAIAIFPDHGADREHVISVADSALYRAKAEGKDRIMIAEHVRTDTYE